MKNKRNIRTFEPDADVETMLNEAVNAGLTLKQVLNDALRECGQSVINRLARIEYTKLKKLSSRSFNQPEHQLAGFAE